MSRARSYTRPRTLLRLLAVAPAALLAGCAGTLLGVANGADLLNGAYRREADLAYGSGSRQRLDVYLPTAPAAAPVAATPAGSAPASDGRARPLVVFIHGGRWSSGAKGQYRFVAAGLAGAGNVVVVPNYRLYPHAHLPDAVADLARAVAWAQANAARWGADPARTVLMGHSAGAQLAALLATDGRPLAAAGARPPAALVGLAGPYDFLPLTDADLIDYFGPPERYPDSQPVNFASAASPPAFLVHGLADRTVKPRNSESLAAHLRSAGVAVELRMTPDEDHGGVLRRFFRARRDDDAVYRELCAFLAEVQPRPAAGLR